MSLFNSASPVWITTEYYKSQAKMLVLEQDLFIIKRSREVSDGLLLKVEGSFGGRERNWIQFGMQKTNS